MRRLAMLTALICISPTIAVGQGGPGGGGGNNQPGGIAIDPNGVVSNLQFKAPSARLAKKHRQAAATKHLSSDMVTWSPLRCVSLVKLQQELNRLVEAGKSVPPEIEYLAGLQRIDYVFVLPDEKDLILAGPGEGFAPSPSGRAIGVTSARPPLRLDDLLTALRTVAKGGQLGCSIDPVAERLAKTQQWIAQNSSPASQQVAVARYEKMAKLLGLQDITLWGLPEDSHLAQVFVEADYRMKRIVMGHENPRVRGFKSHLAMLKPGTNSLRRWWFTPYYDTFEKNEDGTAWHFAGQRAQLSSQEEYSNAAGERFDSPHKLASAEKFAQQFTKKFPDLCRNVAVFAELQNVFDLTVFAALLQKEQMAERISWDMSLLMDADRLPTKTFVPAKQIPTTANCKSYSGRLVLGVVGGGVMINPQRTLATLKTKRTAEVTNRLKTAIEKRVDQWWWDAASSK